MAVAVVVGFQGDKISHEHIYWDQAGVLAQIGLLNPAGLPVTGAESARKVLNPRLPSRVF
jgi:carboxymethylenebutenolidase